MLPPAPASAFTVYWATKLAVTVQLALTAPVVYVVPDSVPPHPVTLLTTKPLVAATVTCVVAPASTVALAGGILPPVPAVALTSYVVVVGGGGLDFPEDSPLPPPPPQAVT